MPPINTGQATRFQNGGFIELDDNSIGKMEGSGLVRITGGSFDVIQTRTGRDLDERLPGNVNAVMVEIQCRFARTSADPGGIANLWKPTFTDGIIDERELRIGVPEGPDSDQYSVLTLDKFIPMDKPDIVPGADYIVCTLRGEHNGPRPDWVNETIA